MDYEVTVYYRTINNNMGKIIYRAQFKTLGTAMNALLEVSKEYGQACYVHELCKPHKRLINNWLGNTNIDFME